MTKLKTPIEVYKLLPKSNCGQCRISTCLAFAAAVIKEQKSLADCPHLAGDVLAGFEGRIEAPVSLEKEQDKSLQHLKGEMATVDFSIKAERLGAALHGDKLVIKCLGKDFEIDQSGDIASQCHTHAGFALPLLSYLLRCGGANIADEWVPFRELKSGATWGALFGQRCEKPLKEIADSHTDLFGDLITIFSGRTSINKFGSDISVVLFPFPKVPMLICYWRPEDGMESKLHLFFDSTAEDNLNIESIFSVGVELVSMLEKIMVKHRL